MNERKTGIKVRKLTNVAGDMLLRCSEVAFQTEEPGHSLSLAFTLTLALTRIRSPSNSLSSGLASDTLAFSFSRQYLIEFFLLLYSRSLSLLLNL